MAASTTPCEHFAAIADVDPVGSVCGKCKALGTQWNELRVCLTCGHVGCCEDSPHAHALAHFDETGHPLIVPLARESWGWCYVHRRYFDPMPELPFRKRATGGGVLARLFGRR